eukprot:gene11290-12471_t
MSKGNNSHSYQNRCIFVSGLHHNVTEEILWELFLQAGPLDNVRIPKDKDTGKIRTFGFIVYQDECSVAYACELFDSLKLFGRPLNCKPQQQNGQKSTQYSPHTDINTSLKGEKHYGDHGRYDSPRRIYDSPINNQDSYGRYQIAAPLMQRPLLNTPPFPSPLLSHKMNHDNFREPMFDSNVHGPMRRHSAMYDRNPAASRMYRRQQTHPY